MPQDDNEDWSTYGMTDSSMTVPETFDNGGDGRYTFPDENYSNEGNHSPLTSLVSDSAPTTDKSLLKTVGDFFSGNKDLASMLLSGVSSGMKGESALKLYNRARDDKLADQKRYSDSVTNMKPLDTGLIGSAMIKNLRGQK